jgi:ketosteroid isomerase-like protein
VLEAATNGTELRLADATDFDWEQAGFVTEGTPATDIDAAFGEPITKEKRYTDSASLFIFLKDGKVAKAVRITPDAFLGKEAKRKYGRDVVLTPLEGRKGILNWVE